MYLSMLCWSGGEGVGSNTVEHLNSDKNFCASPNRGAKALAGTRWLVLCKNLSEKVAKNGQIFTPRLFLKIAVKSPTPAKPLCPIQD